MTKRSADTTTDDDSGLAWLAFADDRIPGISDDIRQEIYREGAHDEQRVLRWVKSALVLRDLGAVEADVGFFFIAFAAECIAESRIDVDPELCRLDRAKAEIAAANGVDVEEYAFIEAQPPEVRELDLQWNARWKVMEVEILRAAGAHDEAVLRERVFPFDERREAGRSALFGPLNLVLQLRLISARTVMCSTCGLLVAALPAGARNDAMGIWGTLLEDEAGQ